MQGEALQESTGIGVAHFHIELANFLNQDYLQGEALQGKGRFMPDYTFEHLHLISEDPQKTADFYIKHMNARNSRLCKCR